MWIEYCGTRHTVRSADLLRFLRLLKDAYPNSLKKADIALVFGNIHRRQLARFCSYVEGFNPPLIAYEKATAGPYRLAVDPKDLIISPTKSGFTKEKPQQNFESLNSLDLMLRPEWIVWVEALAIALHSAKRTLFTDKDETEAQLDRARAVTTKLPAWTKSVVDMCQAHFYERQSDLKQLAGYLQRVNTAFEHGHALQSTQIRAQMCRSKVLYDKGKFEEAAGLLRSVADTKIDSNSTWLNMLGRNLGAQFRRTKDPALLAECLDAFSKGFADIFIMQSDVSLLDFLSFNFANNLLHGIDAGVLPRSTANLAAQWMDLNQFVCQHFQIGDDSILSYLRIYDLIEQYGISPKDCTPHIASFLKCELGSEKFLKTCLKLATKTNNSLEIAQCALRLSLKTQDRTDRDGYYSQAYSHFERLGRDDLISGMKRVHQQENRNLAR